MITSEEVASYQAIRRYSGEYLRGRDLLREKEDRASEDAASFKSG